MWTPSCVYLTCTTVSAWISAVDPLLSAAWLLLLCHLTLNLLGGPPLVCGWLLLRCLLGSGSPQWTSSGVLLTATTVSAWLWISSVDLPWCVPDLYYSVCLALDLLGGSPSWVQHDCCYCLCLALDLLGGPLLVCCWLLLQCLPGCGSLWWISPVEQKPALRFPNSAHPIFSGRSNQNRHRLEAFLVKKRAESSSQHNPCEYPGTCEFIQVCFVSINICRCPLALSFLLSHSPKCSLDLLWRSGLPWLWIFFSWSVLYCGWIYLIEGTCK